MMTKEKQKSGPSNVSCSPKPLDTTTQESSYSEDLEQSIYKMWQLTLEGKKIDGNDLFNLLRKMHHVNFDRIVELRDMYREIIQEDMKFAREDALNFNAQLKKLVVDDRVCNIFSEQFELHFRLSECYNDANIGKLLKDDDIKRVLNTILKAFDEEAAVLYQRYQQILQEKDMAVAEEAASAFNDQLKSLGADDKVCTIFSKQFNSCFLLNEYCNAADTGKCLNDDAIRTVLDMISPEKSEDFYQLYQGVVQEENVGVAYENALQFILALQADDKVLAMFSRQFDSCLLLNEHYNAATTGKLLKDADIKAVLNTILSVSDEKAERLCQDYQRILQEKDMEAAEKAASAFKAQLESLEADDKVCTIFSKQFDSGLHLNKCYNVANIGGYLEDDDIKTVLNTIPGIDAYVYYRRYQQILQEKDMEDARKNAIGFFDDLSELKADDKVCYIIFNQFSYYFDFFAEYYNNEQVADAESVRRLLSKIPWVSSNSIDELCEEYENIINKKDRNGAVDFIEKLQCIGANKIIRDIIQIEFCKAEIILPAEVRPSISGNLFVPGDANLKKSYEYGGKFISELCFGNGNPANRPWGEELVALFKEELMEPFKKCKMVVPSIRLKLRYEEPSPETVKLTNMLDILTSGRIDAKLEECLEIVERFSKELVSEGNIKNDRKLKKITPDSSIDSIRSHLFTELKSKLPSEEDFRVIKECIAILYESEGRVHASAGLKRSIFTRTPFYDIHDGGSFESRLKELVHALTLFKEPLFPHDPCLDDIKQTRIGDCYLLASIISLLNFRGPDFIRNMMIDNGDGTVTVKLYAQRQREYDEGKSHVKYVKVYKSGLMSNPNSALWVQIIEKAYISIGANLYKERKEDELEGIVGYYKNYKKSYPRAVEDLWAGYAKNALRVLANIKCDWLSDHDFLVEEKIKRAISQKLPLVCSFESNFSFNGYNFVCRHAYSIIGAEERYSVTIVKLANPHDAGKNMDCSLESLKLHIASCAIADVDSQTEGMGS